MSVTVENNRYIVIIPEESIRQEFNPDTRQPFASEAEAQGWQDTFMANLAAAKAAAETEAAAAEQTRLSALIHLDIVADQTAVPVGTAINITATLKDGHGDVVPLNQVFAVPIQDSNGNVARIKGVTLVNGTASLSLTFDRSGYYQITEAGINSKLVGVFIGLPAPFEITVFE